MSNFSEMLRRRALDCPEDEAFTFVDGATRRRVDYRTLDLEARLVAEKLGDAAGERALLLYPPGPDYVAAFFGCLYAGVLAVPVYPPDAARWRRSMDRIRAVARDSGARLALTPTALAADVRLLSKQYDELRGLSWSATGQVPDDAASTWAYRDIEPEAPAFLQYTSGSTGAPKGVVLTHRNLVANVTAITEKFGVGKESRGVIWLPPYHDMGLIGGVLAPIFGGFPVTLMSPVDFLRDPMSWLREVAESGATCSGGPNFAYALCVRKSTEEQRRQLDLSGLELAFCGAEPIRADTVRAFSEAFAVSGFKSSAFYPCYGLAESTLIVTGAAAGAEPVLASFDSAALEHGRVVAAPGGRVLVGAGTVIAGHEVAIVDPDTRTRQPGDQVGEIWVSGPSVAAGYWHAQDATRETFHATIEGAGDDRTWLRTGDLGFRSGAELFVTGRRKDLLIVNGRNHHPQDIELSVERAHPAMRPGCGAVFQVSADSDDLVVVVTEVRAGAELSTADADVRRAVTAEHGIPVHRVVFIEAGSLPKTSSGKVQRQLCKDLFAEGDLAEVAATAALSTMDTPEALTRLRASGTLEDALAYLRAVVAELGGVPAMTGTEGGLLDQGLDSLAVVTVVQRVERDLGVDVDLGSLLAADSLVAIAERLLGARRPAPALGDQPPAALGHGQRALWLLDTLTPGDPAYTIARALRVHRGLDRAALRDALTVLTARHESLRTTFDVVDGEPVRVVHECLDPEIDHAAGDATALTAFAGRLAGEAFDLRRGPLLRVGLFDEAHDRHVLVVVVHHIVVDFWSLTVLADELGALLAGESLARSQPTSFGDYVLRQQRYLRGPDAERDEAYWRERLAGDLPEPMLPREPDPELSAEPPVHQFTVSPNLTARVNRMAKAGRTTVFSTLLAAYQVLLHRLTGQDDVIVGSHVADRAWPGAESVVGHCVNPVPLRVDLGGDPTFGAVLDQVAVVVRGALEHHRFPFDLLVDRLRLTRHVDRTPLFGASFGMHGLRPGAGSSLSGLVVNAPDGSAHLGTWPVETVRLHPSRSQFPLTLMLAEVDGRLVGNIEYDPALLGRVSAARFAEQYLMVLAQVVADPGRTVSSLSLLSPSERDRILTASRGPTGPVADLSLGALVEAQAARTPDAVAVTHAGRDVTYRQLDERADLIADRLLHLGIGPEAMVGVCLARTPDLIATLLGVLKAGAAYVPLDPQYPPARTAMVLDQAKPAVVVTTTDLFGIFAVTVPTLAVDTPSPRVPSMPRPAIDPRQVAYVLYTSGSTGTPKGVAIEHRGAVNLIAWAHETFTAEETSGIAAGTSVCFDLSVFEIFTPLTRGGTVILIDTPVEVPSDDPRLTLVNTVPSAVATLLETRGIPSTVRTVSLAGEPLPSGLVGRLHAETGVTRVLNLYGPSETTTYSTWADLPADTADPVPIGRPVRNTEAYVLDSHLAPVPAGVQGELFLGGVGVARGYLGDPGQTAARFVPSPFSLSEGERLYRTGDLVRLLPGGGLHFVGRVDHQIKLRGFRIELGDIEAALRRHPRVGDAVVAPHTVGSRQVLVAFVVTDEAPAGELRAFLRGLLPAYMVPERYVALDRLPLTPNGKLDRARLAVPEEAAGQSDVDRTPPRTDAEKEVAAAFGALLDLPSVGVFDNFFELGGSSLSATRLAAALGDRFGFPVTLREVFEFQTVEALACHLSADRTAVGAQAPIPVLPRVPFARTGSPA
jgi:amino acid adenylation domain-containing protein